MNKRIKKKKGHYKCGVCGGHKEYPPLGSTIIRLCFDCLVMEMINPFKELEVK